MFRQPAGDEMDAGPGRHDTKAESHRPEDRFAANPHLHRIEDVLRLPP
jgi:hypothetical protein